MHMIIPLHIEGAQNGKESTDTVCILSIPHSVAGLPFVGLPFVGMPFLFI